MRARAERARRGGVERRESAMDMIVTAGAVMTLLGLAGIVACIVMVVRARRAGLDDATMRARLQKVVALNLAALFLSAMGLGAVAVGLILG